VSLINLLRENNTANKTYEDLKNLSYRFDRTSIYKEADTIELPIALKNNSNWNVLNDPERLQRIFVFENYREVLYFFEEVYQYQFDINHHCELTIENLDVKVTTYTHGYTGITESDLKIKKMTDDLYNEIEYMKKKNQ
jgi:pterin-4a-carbinolamine dehydratase